tara:strand:+ start:20803 stop:21270 length:468 start_codon:yes stop_codon:yes gene_type:complete
LYFTVHILFTESSALFRIIGYAFIIGCIVLYDGNYWHGSRLHMEKVMAEKYQREIEEILNQIGDEEFYDTKTSRNEFQQKATSRLSRILPSGSRPVWLLFASLFVSCMVISATIPGIIGPILWLGLIIFLVGYTRVFLTSNNKEEKRWRGRVIDD